MRPSSSAYPMHWTTALSCRCPHNHSSSSSSRAAQGRLASSCCPTSRLSALQGGAGSGTVAGSLKVVRLQLCASVHTCHTQLPQLGQLPHLLTPPHLCTPPHTSTPHRYLSNVQDLVRFCCCMHLLPQPPAALVVIGLSRLMAGGGRWDGGKGGGLEVCAWAAALVYRRTTTHTS